MLIGTVSIGSRLFLFVTRWVAMCRMKLGVRVRLGSSTGTLSAVMLGTGMWVNLVRV